MTNNLIVPWEQSKWLVCSSLFFAVPSVQAFINKQYYCSGLLHRPKRKMRQNAVMIYIFYNYVSGSLLNVPLLFSSLKY